MAESFSFIFYYLILLPSLTCREAVFVCEATALPSRIRIKKLPDNKLPDSSDIGFIEGWMNEPIDETALNKIVDRWVSIRSNKLELKK